MLNTDGVAGNQAQPASLVGFVNMEIDMYGITRIFACAMMFIFLLLVIPDVVEKWIELLGACK